MNLDVLVAVTVRSFINILILTFYTSAPGHLQIALFLTVELNVYFVNLIYLQNFQAILNLPNLFLA